MKFRVRHDLPRRVRFVIDERLGFPAAIDQVERAALSVVGVESATLSITTGSLVVRHDGRSQTRAEVERSLTRLALDPSASPRPRLWDAPVRTAGRELLASAVVSLISAALPLPLRAGVTLLRALPLLRQGASLLQAGRLESTVLDSAAVGTALGMGDFSTASSISFLLQLGDYLRARTEAHARRDLAAVLQREDRPVWVRRGGVEVELEARELRVGDVVVVRAGHLVPVDGQVKAGVALVDQSSMTGESVPVARHPGSRVFEGTTVVDGAIEVEALEIGEQTRFAQVVRLIAQSEKEKALVQARADSLADRLVPWVFGMAGLTQLLTGQPRRAASVLLVDYSCALKLSVPISISTCLTEALAAGVMVRGGKFVEALAGIDTVVFDKTGTLTESRPKVVGLHVFGGVDPRELLRETACVEEHFPHPFAAAILQEALRQGLAHRDELHGEVKYLVAQGIVSVVNGKHFVVGSRRFLAERGVDVGADRTVDLGTCSAVYVGVGNRLAGIVMLEDPLRAEARQALQELRALGIKHLVMLTGDNAANAARVASIGFDEWHAELSPEDKVKVIARLKAEGRKVAMVGDGINDAAALAAADVGVSFQHGADLAKEAADVLMLRQDLRSLAWVIEQCRRAMKRVSSNFALIGGINTALIGLGFVGLVPPSLSALLHNGTTVLTSLRSLRPYMGSLASGPALRAGPAQREQPASAAALSSG